ncbi:hypothetical protein LCGC14_2821410, partial [marine sediment metagenome]
MTGWIIPTVAIVCIAGLVAFA